MRPGIVSQKTYRKSIDLKTLQVGDTIYVTRLDQKGTVAAIQGKELTVQLGSMAMAHMQRAGHRPICLVGGGTGTVGDPSGRTDMRKMLTDEMIEHNCNCFKKQMQRFIDFNDGRALMNSLAWRNKL